MIIFKAIELLSGSIDRYFVYTLISQYLIIILMGIMLILSTLWLNLKINCLKLKIDKLRCVVKNAEI
jgi:hypothetical protein